MKIYCPKYIVKIYSQTTLPIEKLSTGYSLKTEKSVCKPRSDSNNDIDFMTN